ncbi:UDP-glycosyltransferase TURAN [Galdieria sulphuraria]|nr:UDP-glycosyltransferase TURAN [Galdieria sulphuraria]
MWYSLYLAFILFVLHLVLLSFLKSEPVCSGEKIAAVVVLGDLERSPRIVNQAVCLSRCGWLVDLVGFVDAKKGSSVYSNERVCVISLKSFFHTQKRFKLLYAITALLVALERFILLIYRLCCFQRPHYSLILVQNPPSVPTLAVAWFASRFIHRAAFVIDWHNFGYTMMQISHAPNILVSLAKAYERYFGQLATANFCVCAAAQNFLQKYWNITSVLLYDCPTERFRNSTRDINRLHLKQLYISTLEKLQLSCDRTEPSESNFPLVAISSTSWTPDENMHLLLDVCIELDRRCALKFSGTIEKTVASPKLYILITGRGPQRASFVSRLLTLNLQYILVDTVWLQWEEYVQLLKTADFGISLHFSSSGIDLPMKVVDMFACGLPVLSYRYGCIDELIHQGKNGLLFENADELCDILFNLLSVEDEWLRTAKPVLESIT